MAAATPVDRVFDALEAAACAAEGSPPHTLVQPISMDDFRAAAKLDARALRDRLDRVVMGEDPERGLDELLEAGALVGALPRGACHGGLRRRRVAAQGRVEAHEASGAPVRAAARGALGGPLPRHRQGQDALDHGGRQGPLPRSRRGGHAHVREARPASRALRARARAQRAPCASSCCTTCAPTSTRPTGPTAPCAASRASSASTSRTCSASRGRHHDQAPREEAQRPPADRGAPAAHHARWPRRTRACRRCRAASATRSCAPSGCRRRARSAR